MGRDPRLVGQTLLVLGGSSGIGLETARRAHEEGAAVIITARDPERVQRAGLELEGSIAAFDATDFDRLGRFFEALRTPIDHVLVSGPKPHEAMVSEYGVDQARSELEAHLLLPLHVAGEAASKVRAGGTLLFTGCAIDPRAVPGFGFISAITAALSVVTKSLAFELAPIRVNLIAIGCLDPAQSAASPRDRLRPPPEELGLALPSRRVISAADVASLAVHLMTNSAVTGGTFEIDGGRQPVDG